MRTRILTSLVDRLSMEESLERIAGLIAEGRPGRVVTLNPELAYRASREPKLREVLNGAGLITADGEGIVWAARRLGSPVPERVTGIDLMLRLAERAARQGWSLYLYGAAPGVAAEAALNLQGNFPGLRIAGHSHGYLCPEEEAAMLREIREKRPHILLVALGAPRQELWIASHLEELGVPVAMGVGGSLDVVAGRVGRAPNIFRRLRLEWLYRLLREPRRYKRMLVLPRFAWLVLKQENFMKKRWQKAGKKEPT